MRTSHETAGLESWQPPRWSWWVLGLCLAAAALALRLYGLTAADLSEDEELATGLPHLSYAELLSDIAGRPPIIFVAQKALMSITGKAGPLEIRLPSVLAGAAAVVVLFLLAARVANPATGLAAAAMLCCSHFCVTWCRDGRYYGLLTLVSLLFLWCYWEFLRNRKPWALPALAVTALALPLTHHGGALLLAACLAVAPAFLCTAPWRAWIKGHPRRTAAAGVALALCLAATFPVWRRLARIAMDMANRGPGAPLPAFFDVSPAFLLNRLAEVTAIPRPYTYIVLILLVLGFVAAARKAPLFAVLAASILIVPFALLWFFRPQHWWHPKYFIFMAPVLAMVMAWGIASILDVTRALAHDRLSFRLGGWAVCSALFLATVVPNLGAVFTDLAHPNQDFQQMAAVLASTPQPPERIGYSWKEAWRVLRTYYPTANDAERTAFLEADDVAPWPLEAAPDVWFLHSGKMSKSHPVSAALLSDRLSRIAYLNAFLAFGPNTQRIAFGENHPGAPGAGGPLEIAPGETAIVEVLFPRAGPRAVFVQTAGASTPPSLALALGDQTVIPLEGAGGLLSASVEAPFGRARASLVNQRNEAPVTVEAIEFLPVFAEAALEIPAWDFYSLEGDALLDSVWTDRRDGRIVLRDLRSGHTAYYRFLCARAGPATVRVSALNDPPGANRYQVFVPGATEAAVELAFDREDGSISAQETPALRLQRGVYTICVTYVGLTFDEMQALTDGFRIMTQERMQTAGLEKIEVVPTAP